MARESKGQQVKSFKDRIPQADQTFVEVVTKVYFKVTDGLFVIYVPEHIARAISGVEGFERGDSAWKGEARVQADTLEEVLLYWESAKDSYLRTIRLEGAVKVIRYRLWYNDKDRFRQYNDPAKLENVWGAPALAVHYEIMWRSENKLYRGHYSGDSLILDFEGHALPSQFDVARVIEWTEEREAFFEAVQGGILRLVEQMKEFMGADIESNIAQLASGERKFLLAAPADG